MSGFVLVEKTINGEEFIVSLSSISKLERRNDYYVINYKHNPNSDYITFQSGKNLWGLLLMLQAK